MELLLLRHSITPGNLKKQYIGVTDQPLAPEGEALAREKQPDMPRVEALWISPMLRCRHGFRQVLQQARQLEIQRGAVVAHGGTWMAVLEAYGRPKRAFYQWQPANCSGFRMEVREEPLELRLLEEL